MVNHLTRRTALILALLFGALVSRPRSMSAQPVLDREGAVELHTAMPVFTDVYGVWCPSQLSEWAPAGKRSPSWHRGAGRRNTRSAGFSPMATPAGSIPAYDPFIPQRVASFVRSALPLESTGRCAASPRAPPAVN